MGGGHFFTLEKSNLLTLHHSSIPILWGWLVGSFARLVVLGSFALWEVGVGLYKSLKCVQLSS